MVKIVKSYNKDFTIVHNTIFKINEKLPDDYRISFKAMGIFMYLWHLPSDWNFIESELVRHGKEKLTAFRSGREELERAGFITKKRCRNAKGQLLDYKWILNDNPSLKNIDENDHSSSDYPKLDNPNLDNQQLLSTNCTKYGLYKVRNKGTGKNNYIFKEYESLWGMPSVILKRKLLKLIQCYSYELVAYAIKKAGRNHISQKESLNYINRILSNCQKLKVHTLCDMKSDSNECFDKSRPYINHYKKRDSNNTKPYNGIVF